MRVPDLDVAFKPASLCIIVHKTRPYKQGGVPQLYTVSLHCHLILLPESIFSVTCSSLFQFLSSNQQVSQTTVCVG